MLNVVGMTIRILPTESGSVMNMRMRVRVRVRVLSWSEVGTYLIRQYSLPQYMTSIMSEVQP